MNNKHVFWQAFVVASIIFWIGIFLGIYYENDRMDTIEDFYFDSQTDVFDFELASNIVYDSGGSCEFIADKSVFFADRIYEEARSLEKYDHANKITSEYISLHRRYDFLRVMLWKNIVDSKKECGEHVNTVIYLYNYDNPSLTTKAMQRTMSSALIDLKKEYGDKVILIPIAVDTNIESLSVLMDFYELEKSPVVFINEKVKITDLDSLGEMKDAFQTN